MTKVLTEVMCSLPIKLTQEISATRASSLCRRPRFAILTCMDARLDPAKFAGLEEGERM